METKVKEDNIRKILKNLKSTIKELLGDKFIDMILFGSYARGDFTEYSDVDVLILVKNELNIDESEKIDEFVAEFSLKYDMVISCLIYAIDLFEEYNTPFLLNVKNEGVKI